MTLITLNDRFAIFGARGMAGSAISRASRVPAIRSRSTQAALSLIFLTLLLFSSGSLTNNLLLLSLLLRRWRHTCK